MRKTTKEAKLKRRRFRYKELTTVTGSGHKIRKTKEAIEADSKTISLDTQAESPDVQTEALDPPTYPLSSELLVQKKAKERGDQTFTLVGQDLTSPETIGFWIMKNIETAPEEKLLEVVTIAVRMRKNFGRKHAD